MGGSIFSFSAATLKLTTLYRFSGVSGSSHLLTAAGDLFGATINAGPADAGTVFKEIP